MVSSGMSPAASASAAVLARTVAVSRAMTPPRVARRTACFLKLFPQRRSGRPSFGAGQARTASANRRSTYVTGPPQFHEFEHIGVLSFTTPPQLHALSGRSRSCSGCMRRRSVLGPLFVSMPSLLLMPGACPVSRTPASWRAWWRHRRTRAACWGSFPTQSHAATTAQNGADARRPECCEHAALDFELVAVTPADGAALVVRGKTSRFLRGNAGARPARRSDPSLIPPSPG